VEGIEGFKVSNIIVAIAMVKDEADVIGHTLRHMLAHGCDHILVADNLSTDATPKILDALVHEFPDRIIPAMDRVVAYYQAEKMTALYNHARDYYGAEWVIPFDADELFCTDNGFGGGPSLKTLLEAAGEFPEVIEVEMANHFPTCRDNPDDPNPFTRLSRRHRPPNRLPKVIVRAKPGMTLTQGNHSALYQSRPPMVSRSQRISIRHFPYRSENQFIRKALNGAEAYKAAKDLPTTLGEHWRHYGEVFEQFGHEGLRDHFKHWFYFGEDRIEETILDPAPLRRTA
jgi:glycosyltransferase involved in cell wall biosynthesis